MKEIIELKNIYTIFKGDSEIIANATYDDLFKEKTLEEILKDTIVFAKSNFSCQRFNTKNLTSDCIFYIQKYNKIFLYEDLYEFIKERPEENFILLPDINGETKSLVGFVDSRVNKIHLSILSTCNGQGHFSIIQEFENIDNTCIWHGTGIVELNHIYDWNRDGNLNGSEIYYFEDKRDESSWNRTFTDFEVIGTDKVKMNTENVLLQYLYMKGHTRIATEFSNYAIYYHYESGEIALKSPLERYGLTKDKNRTSSWYSQECLNFNDIIGEEADLDPEEKDRLFSKLKYDLENEIDVMKQISTYSGYYHGGEKCSYTTKSILALSKPLKGCRRPIYHWIVGFKSTMGDIDIIELSRGELMVQNMIPASVYYLVNEKGIEGKYAKLQYSLMSSVRDEIQKNNNLDISSFLKWSEEKSLHPKLLQTVIDFDIKNKITLQTIKIFNKLPFGATFMEHLIKNSMFREAENFAKFINDRADNMNYVCSNLGDVLPGCNPEGTTLLKVLNMTKPMFDLFNKYNNVNTGVEDMIQLYVNIKRICHDNTVTKEREKYLQQILKLKEINYNTIRCDNGNVVQVSDYPEETKSILKMYQKIVERFSGYSELWTAERHYREIVEAYFKFLDFGWRPSDYLIFIEFSVPEHKTRKEILEELHSREQAANVALNIYKAKINEGVHARNEEKYAKRKKTLSKLLLNKKDKGKNKIWDKYDICVPSQIYGLDINGSIEKEGHDAKHCVFRAYADKIIEGDYTVLYLRLKDALDETLCTIGINKEGRINQTYTFDDQGINKEMAEAIVAWAKTKEGLVTFRSEHTNIMPGGWCHGITIPDLPEPSKEWLKKLANK